MTGPPDAGAAIGIRTTRSAICSASSRSWVMMSTVTPRDLSVRNSSWIRFLAWASRLAVGSSMMSTSGLQASTPAMLPIVVARRTGRRGSGRQDARYAAVPVIRARGRLPRSRQALGCVGRTPRPRLPCQRTADALDAASRNPHAGAIALIACDSPTSGARCDRACRSRPPEHRPLRCCRRSAQSVRHNMRTSVDLPEPFTPISATVSPRAMVNDRSSITARLAEG